MLTEAEKAAVRAIAGYPAATSSAEPRFPWSVCEQIGAMEYRMNNLTAGQYFVLLAFIRASERIEYRPAHEHAGLRERWRIRLCEYFRVPTFVAQIERGE